MSPHRQILTGLVQKHGWKSGAELGVQKGILSTMLMDECPELSLLGVDVFDDPKHLARCQELSEALDGRYRLLVMTTHNASAEVEDGSLDFVFIDADHSDPAVSDDIAQWRSKVRPGGWLGGHDYNRKFPGVVTAVDRAFGAKVKTWPGSIWGVWL